MIIIKNNKEFTLHLQVDKVFGILLKVDFKDMGDYWLMEAKKLKFKFESTDKDVVESQKEFGVMVKNYIIYMIKNKELFSTLDALGFNIMSLDKAYKHVQKTSKKQNLYSVNSDNALNSSSFIAINNLKLSWDTNSFVVS